MCATAVCILINGAWIVHRSYHDRGMCRRIYLTTHYRCRHRRTSRAFRSRFPIRTGRFCSDILRRRRRRRHSTSRIDLKKKINDKSYLLFSFHWFPPGSVLLCYIVWLGFLFVASFLRLFGLPYAIIIIICIIVCTILLLLLLIGVLVARSAAVTRPAQLSLAPRDRCAARE